MASLTTGTAAVPSSVDTKAVVARQQAPAAPHSVGLPTLPPPPHVMTPNRGWKTTASCRQLARNVMATATGDAPAEISTELPEFVTKLQDAWEKVEDKYAVASLGVAGVVAVWASAGMISAVDRLPLLPGVFELVGIGYTGWFAYRNLVFKPDRQALLDKIKKTYSEIIGSS